MKKAPPPLFLQGGVLTSAHRAGPRQGSKPKRAKTAEFRMNEAGFVHAIPAPRAAARNQHSRLGN